MMRPICLVIVAFLTLALPAQGAEPLLQAGKTQLYERILLREDVPQRGSPEITAPGKLARALDPFYVYQRRESEGEAWLLVAAGTDGRRSFWVPERQTTAWRQAIVLKFTTLGNAERLLIFDDIDSLYEVVESEDPASDAATLREGAASGAAEGPILALGPELGVDTRQNFYMLPILEAEQAVFEQGGFVNLLNVAIAKSGSQQRRGGGAPTTRRQALEDFSTGVVFAIDTTRSMGPYFEPVMNAVAEIYGRLQGSGAAGQLSFGLVGFRDAVVRQDIEYLSRTFVPLTSASNPEAFVQGLTEMREATGSTKGFNEDSFAGVKHALDSMEWSGVDARFVVLVTDAGPRVGNDPLSATGLGARGLANYAKDIRGAHVLTLHLTTPRGNHTHGFAAQAYTELSRVGSADPLYYEVPDGTPGNLERSARLVADALAGAILAARQGEEIDVDGYTPPVDATEAEAELGRRTLKVARSMQLDYLGSETSAEAPDVFEGWIADRDFRNNGVKPIEVRLLVNRSQMSDLYEAMRLVVEKGEESGLEPTTFFQKVLTAAAEMSRRPDNVAAIAEDASIADAALIGELLEGLPYRSQIMGIDESAWLSMNIAEQTELLDLLADKVARYEDAIAGVDNWVLLNPDQTSDEAVYPMPLENLP